MIQGVEIFSGAGGLAKGLELAGVRHQAFVEWNKQACSTLRVNFEESKVFEGDIRNYNFSSLDDIDILAGGPPCQPFSLGGKAQGHNDERDMFPFAVNAIRTIRPKAFIFENVKGLLRESFKKYFNYIILQLQYPCIELPSQNWKENYDYLKKESLGMLPVYQVTYNLVNAADYGVPQKRERVIIVGFRSDLGVNWKFPKPTHSEDALLWSQFITGDYWKKHNINNTYDKKTSDTIKATLNKKYGFWVPELLPWLTIRDSIDGLEEQGTKEAREYPGHTGSFIDGPSKTIKAGAHGVPGGENMVRFPNNYTRYLTIDEAKRIQTFPDDYSITGSWTEGMRQLGNAVPVKLAYIIAESVVNAITKNSV